MERLRLHVASLKVAVAFTQAGADAMPLLTQLLASSQQSDVAEAIALLIACRKFEVPGPHGLASCLPAAAMAYCPAADPIRRLLSSLEWWHVVCSSNCNFALLRALLSLHELACAKHVQLPPLQGLQRDCL